jgi:hypothetical protein
MCAPTSPDYVPTLPNNFQVLPPSPEFGFDFINAFVSDDEEEPFEVLTDEEEEETMPTNFASNTSNYFEQNWVEADFEEDDEYEYVLAPFSPPLSLPFHIPTYDELDHSLWIVSRPSLIQQESQHGNYSLSNFIDSYLYDTLNQEVADQSELLGPSNPQ